MVAFATSLILLAALASSATAAPIKTRSGSDSDAFIDIDVLSGDPAKARIVDADVNSATYKNQNHNLKRTTYYYEDDNDSLIDIDVGHGSYYYDHSDDSEEHGSLVDVDILRRGSESEVRRALLDVDIGGDDHDHVYTTTEPTDTPTGTPMYTSHSNVHLAHHGGAKVGGGAKTKTKAKTASKSASIKASIKTRPRPRPVHATKKPASIKTTKPHYASINANASVKTSPDTIPTQSIDIATEATAPVSATTTTIYTDPAPAPATTTIYTETDHGSLLDLDILKRDEGAAN